MSRTLSFLFALAVAVSPARAQQAPALVTDRPDQTESALTVPPGLVQVEGGAEYAGEDALGAAFLARVGLTPLLEMRLGGGTGLDAAPNAASVGLKLRLWPGLLQQTHAALLVTADQHNFGAIGRLETRLSLAHALRDRLEIGYNAGVVWYPESRHANMLYTLALGFDATDRTGAFVELHGEGEFPGFDGGLTFLLAPTLQLDVVAGHSLRNSGYFVGGGISYRLPR